MILHGNGVYKLLGPYIPESLLPFNQGGKSILISLENVIAFCSSSHGHSSHGGCARLEQFISSVL